MLVSELAAQLGARLIGDTQQPVTAVSNYANADPNSVVFALDPEAYARAVASGAGAIIAGAFATAPVPHVALLVHNNPKLAFARAAKLLAKKIPVPIGVHPAAIVARDVVLGEAVAVAPYAVVGHGARIGDRTIIGVHSVIAAGVVLGSDCVIHSNVTIYPNTELGDRIVVHSGCVLGSDGFGYVLDGENGEYEQFPQIGRLIIQDDVEIGANSTIDRGSLDETLIGRGTKIDNLVHIGHNVRIGEDVVIAAQTGISGSSIIEKNAVIAGQVGIADHVTIQEGVILGAQSGVPTGKIVRGRGVVFWGTPARPIREYLKQIAVLARLSKGK